ncbi:MAG: hypothetical protein JXR37_30105 [Kiritimatiellae bacterium]|nr:hypothetical protein [Kiritimatiellia bacterium]
MDLDTVIGTIVVGLAVLFVVVMVVWSRRIIGRIVATGGRSAREIERALNGGG